MSCLYAGRAWRTAIVLLVVACLPSLAAAQVIQYSFDPSDGFPWPASIPSGLEFETPDDIIVYNWTFGDLHINSSHTGLDNTSRFSAPNTTALWGDMIDGQLGFQFAGFDNDQYDYISFDFAWYGNHTSTSPNLDISFEYDDWSGYDSHSFTLQDSFSTSSGHTGYEGQIVIDASALALNGGVNSFTLDLGYVGGGVFALNNLYLSDAPPQVIEPDPDNQSQLAMTFNGGVPYGGGVGLPVLQDSFNGTYVFIDEISNFGPDATYYSLTYDGDLVPPPGHNVTQRPIEGNTTLSIGSLALGVPTNRPSGDYHGTVMLHNLVNPNDPGDTLDVDIRIYAPATHVANNTQTIDLGETDQLTLSVDPVESHPGARRAGLLVINQQITHGFYIDGNLNVNDIIQPGQTGAATVGFDAAGMIAGVYEGAYTIDVRMVATDIPGISHAGINGVPFPSQPVTWLFTHTVDELVETQASVASGQNFGQAAIGIRNTDTAVQLIDGQSVSALSVAASFVMPPPSDKPILGSAVELTLSDVVDYYVMQITYLDNALPAGFDELLLRLNVYDLQTQDWVEAVMLNSDGGEGAIFFEGSYAEYLNTIGTLPALGAYGVDTEANHVWAVLDHNSTFAIVIPEPTSLTMLLVGAVAMLRRRR